MDNLSTPEYLLKGDDKRYDDSHDVHMRLTKTIVRFKGEPVFVNEVAGGCSILVTFCNPKLTSAVVDSNDIRLDISSPKLGYINYHGNAYYVSRLPVRSQRQGLDIPRLLFWNPHSGENCPFGVDTELLLSFGQMIRREYPLVSSSPVKGGMAFSRTWAVTGLRGRGILLLHHRTEAVGTYNPENRKFKLHPSSVNPLRLASLQSVISKQNGEYYEVDW